MTLGTEIKTGYIYGLFDSRESVYLWNCRYIGLTGETPEYRLTRHIQESLRGTASYKGNWIRSVLDGDGEIIVRTFELHTAPDKKALNILLGIRERQWIAEGRRQGWKLTNGTDGGDGCLGLVITLEHRAKLSAANKGHVVSATQRAQISIAHKGKPGSRLGHHNSPEHNAKIGAANKGKVLSPENLLKIRETAQNRVLTDETRTKMSVAQMGNQNALGHKHTDEAKAKMRGPRSKVQVP